MVSRTVRVLSQRFKARGLSGPRIINSTGRLPHTPPERSGLLRSIDRGHTRVCYLCLVVAPMIWLASAGLALIIAAFLLRWWAQGTAAALDLSGEVPIPTATRRPMFSYLKRVGW
jgi:hypothetical protein